MNQKQNNKKWEQYGEIRNLGRNILVLPHHRKRLLTFLDFFSQLPTDLKILDIGCASGLNLTLLFHLGFEDIEGIDLVPQFVERARRLNLNVRQADLFLYQSEHKYDVVICTEVLEHLEDPELALKKIREFLKEEGIIYLSVPVYDSVKWRVRRLLFKETREFHSKLHDETHINAFSWRSVKRLLERNNFEIFFRVIYWNPLPKIGENILGRFLNKLFPQLGDFLIIGAKKKS